MVKAMKFVVLASGLIGLIAFFLPILSVGNRVDDKLSAFEIVKGIEFVQERVKQQAPRESVEAKRAIDEFDRELDEYKGLVLAVFAPAALLLVFGLIATLRGRFGRGLAIFTLLVGAVGLGIWALLDAAANEVSAEDGESVKGIAMHLLMVTGLGGTLAGLVATIKPDRG